MKMGTALESRGLASHIFETQQEAMESAAANE
jgi:hypothetical protein